MSAHIVAGRILQQTASAVAGLLTGLLTARWLGVEGKGVLAFIGLVSTISSQLGTLGVHNTVAYLCGRVGLSLGDLRRAFDWFVLLWGVPLAAATGFMVYSASPAVARVQLSVSLSAIVAVTILARLAGLLYKSTLLSAQRYSAVSALDFFDAASPGLLFVPLAFLSQSSLVAAAAAFMFAPLLVAFTARSLSLRHSLSTGIRLRTLGWRIVKYGARTYLWQIALLLLARGEMFIVGFYLGPSGLGLYAVALTLGDVLIKVPDAVAWMLMPLAANAPDYQARQISARYARISAAATLLLAAPFWYVANVALRTMLPAFQHAAAVLMLLLPGAVALAVSRVLSADLVARGRAGAVAAVSWVCIALLPIHLVLVPKLGVYGAALGSTTVQIALACFTVSAFCRHSDLTYRQVLLLNAGDATYLARVFRTHRQRLVTRVSNV